MMVGPRLRGDDEKLLKEVPARRGSEQRSASEGKAFPSKNFKNCPDLLTIGISVVIFSAQVCSFGVFCLYAKGVDDERH